MLARLKRRGFNTEAGARIDQEALRTALARDFVCSLTASTVALDWLAGRSEKKSDQRWARKGAPPSDSTIGHPILLLDAIKLWSPEFARRLDQLKLSPADEIRMAAQQRRRARLLHERVQDADGNSTAKTMHEIADDLVNPGILDSLRGDLAALREGDRWDDKDRLINASELTGRLIRRPI